MSATEQPVPAPQVEASDIDEKKVLTETTAAPKAEEAAPEKPADPEPADKKEESTPATEEASAPNSKRKTPIEHPLPTCKPVPHPPLTEEQAKKYADILSIASAWTEIPTTSAKNAPKEPITDSERMWLTRECLLRYLRAVNWDTNAATQRLLSTLTWRREYGVEGFTPEYIAPEQETGKQIIMGYDNEGRPCHYLNPSRQNTEASDRQVHHLVFMLERVIDLMPPGQENLALLISFRESSRGSTPSFSTGKQVLYILQNHYPERLGRALITYLPWYVSAFLKLVSPFIDPATKQKMKYNEPLTDHVPKSQLLEPFGGEIELDYDFPVYWSALNELCDKRRKELRERWEKAGKKIGESELYLKGGDEKSVAT